MKKYQHQVRKNKISDMLRRKWKVCLSFPPREVSAGHRRGNTETAGVPWLLMGHRE